MASAMNNAARPPASRRRAAPAPALFFPDLGNTLPRRAPAPAALPLPAGLDILPLPADRDRIKALVCTLIDWLDAQDAPQSDMEPDADCEDSGDTELSEPADGLVHHLAQLGFYGHPAAQVRAGGLGSTVSHSGGPC